MAFTPVEKVRRYRRRQRAGLAAWTVEVDVAAVTWLLIDGGHLQWEAAEDRRAAQAALGDLINSLAWSAAARRR